MRRHVLATIIAMLLFALPAAAQQAASPAPKRERGFISINGGVQAASAALTDRFTYQVNAESASVETRYPGQAGTLFDGGAGLRLFKAGGIAVAFSRSAARGTAQVEAGIPHPFFDDQDRHVAGEAPAIDRTETAVHVQLYLLRQTGRWRIRVMGGGTRFTVEQDIVTSVSIDEEYPFDTAAFRSATTNRARGSATGFNVGGDVAWMFTPQVGVGAVIRFTRGSVDLNADGGRNVSLDAGGAQAGAGLRISF